MNEEVPLHSTSPTDDMDEAPYHAGHKFGSSLGSASTTTLAGHGGEEGGMTFARPHPQSLPLFTTDELLLLRHVLKTVAHPRSTSLERVPLTDILDVDNAAAVVVVAKSALAKVRHLMGSPRPEKKEDV